MDWTWACISTSLNNVFKNCPAFHTNDLICAQYMFVLVYLRSNGKRTNSKLQKTWREIAYYTLEMLFCIQVIECFSTIKEACKIVVKIRYSPYMYNNIPLGCDWNGLVVRILELI